MSSVFQKTSDFHPPFINFPAKQFECEECNKKFDSKKAVGQHKHDIHIKFGCKFCGKYLQQIKCENTLSHMP